MLRGKSVSGGVAVGRAVILRGDHGSVTRRILPPETIPKERHRLQTAARAAARRLRGLAAADEHAVGSEVSAILAAHALLAEDPAFLGPVERMIARDHVNAEWALVVTAEELRRHLAGSDNPVFSERGSDVVEVARAIIAELSPGRTGRIAIPAGKEAPVLVADELSPAQAAHLDPKRLGGIALEKGGVHSHAAIIARSFGIPAVVAVEGLLAATGHDRPILIDGDRGIVEANPTREQLRRALERRREARLRARRPHRRPSAFATADGTRVFLRANLELPQEGELLSRYGAEGVGLFRSEFLYLESPDERPSVEAQCRVYQKLLREAGAQPVVIRTYDLGGEKGLSPEGSASSALGLRGIRYSLAEIDLFRDQLRALLRASRRGDLRIMLPMVSARSEVLAARKHLEAIAREERIEKLPPLGIMIEVPAAAILADSLADAADFLSIGTNDLTQYTLAADRGDPNVVAYYRPLSPAVLRMIKLTVEAGRRRQCPVSVCGELAADPGGATLLVGLGLRELSMSPVLLPKIQDLLPALDRSRAEQLAARALECAEADEVGELVARFRKKGA